MLQAMIVDDEATHRIGLSNYVKWNKYGFDIPICCAGADEALGILRMKKIDLIFLDINMPGKTGLEMIKDMLDSDLDYVPEIIITSGYDEFSYAREAISLGVRVYLLKPLKLEEVEAWLEKIMKEKSIKKKDFTVPNQDLIINLHLKNIIYTGKSIDFNTIELSDELSILRKKFYSMIILLRINPDEISSIEYTKNNVHIINNIFSDSVYKTILDLKYNEVMIFAADKSDTVLKDGLQKFKIINQNKVCFIDEIEYTSSNELYQLYVKTYLKFDNTKVDNRFDELHDMYINAIENRNIMKIEQCNQNIQSIPQETSFIPLKIMLLNIAIFYSKMLKDNNVQNLLWELSMSVNRDKMEKIILKYYEIYKDKIQNESPVHFVVQHALAHIKGNYMKEINVRDIAKKYNINYSYFSTLFKKEMGKSISIYIMDYRMEKAKELILTSNMKLYAIGETVGMNTPAFFTKQFKKKYGCTPKQLRNSIKTVNNLTG